MVIDPKGNLFFEPPNLILGNIFFNMGKGLNPKTHESENAFFWV